MVTVKRRRAEEVWITFRGKQRQVKPCGIRDPDDRVKGYRVEIRPPRSKDKIWLGTFETRHKAQRAYDAAVYLVGKAPHYHLYPSNYFPRRRNTTSSFQTLRNFVKEEAKNFAEKIDHLLVNPSSLIPEMIEEDPVKGSDDQEPLENMNHRDPVQDMDDQEAPVEEVNEQELVGDLDDQELAEDMVPAAYLRGLKADPYCVNALLAHPPPESFTVFSSIQNGEFSSILDVFEENPAFRLILSPEREPAHAQFGGVDCSGIAVDGEGGYGDSPLEDPVQGMDDQEPPVQDVNEQEPPVEDMNEQEPVGDLDDHEPVEDMVPAAYRRGLKAADPGVANALLDYPPPESFNRFSPIQDAKYSILDVFKYYSDYPLELPW